jgi:hypothetical protein
LLKDTQTCMIRCSGARTRSALFLFFLGISFFCCKKPDDEFIGRDILPSSDNLQFSETDTLSILSYTVKDDSVRTDERFYNPLGLMNDPVFGLSSTTIFTQLRLPENNLDFSAVNIDSIVLTLKYTGKTSYYGNLSSQQTIKVYELTESLRLDSSYYSNSSAAYDPLEIGSWTGVFNLTDSLTIVQGSKVKKVPPQLRIPITSSAFINKIKTAGVNFATSEAFLQYIKGVAIVPQNTGMLPGDGALVNVSVASTYSNLTIYYNDSLSKDFLINENSPRFNNHQHDYSGTLIAQQLGLKQDRDTTYGQSMAGLKTFIKFPQLFDLVKKHGNKPLAILGAELSIPVIPSSGSNYPLPVEIVFVTVDSMGKNYTVGGTLYGYIGKYNSAKTEVSVNLTTYLQSVLNTYRRTGREADYGLYLVPSYNYPGMERVVLNMAGSGSVKPRLKLTYNAIP